MVPRLPDSWSNWNLKMLVFEERGKPEYPEENLSEQRREPTTNKLNPHMASTAGFEPGPHWWEASALITAPSLAPPSKGCHMETHNTFWDTGSVNSVHLFLKKTNYGTESFTRHAIGSSVINLLLSLFSVYTLTKCKKPRRY